MIRVVLADDQSMIRSGIRGILSAAADIDVVGEAIDGRDALVAVRRHLPDVVIMDLRMPVMDGVEATRELRAAPLTANVKVLVLTTFEQDEYVVTAVRAGAEGFLGKGAEPEELVEAVRSTVSGRIAMSAKAVRAIVDHVAAAPRVEEVDQQSVLLASTLTDREREIVVLAAEGRSNDEVASALYISPYTVKTHLHRAMGKIGVRDRSGVVVFAYRAGLVHPPT